MWDMYLIFWDNKILLDVCLPSISTHKKHFNINYSKTQYYYFCAEYVHNCQQYAEDVFINTLPVEK